MLQKKYLFLFFVLSIFSVIPKVSAKIKVVTTTTNLAFAAKEIGGNTVDVESLLYGAEDVHYVDASPAYIRKVANADIVCAVGLDLEIGWLPKVLSKSGNAKVQPGGKGFCELGRAVDVLDKPKGPVDRSMGDTHPHGNPHFDLSPEYLVQGAAVIKKVLQDIDPENSNQYQENYKRFSERMLLLQKKIIEKIAPAVKNNRYVLEYHKEFSYFFHTYGIRSLGAIESLPGVPPSAGRIAEIARQAKEKNAFVALASTASPRKVLEKFQEISGVPFATLPIYILANQSNDSYENLQMRIANTIIEHLKK